MSENAKVEEKAIDLSKPLPEPVWPKLEMPEPPKGGMPEDKGIPDCEGFVNQMPDVAKSPVIPPKEGVARIMIAIPLLAITYEFFESFLKFWTELVVSRDPRYEVSYHIAYRKPVHMAEEYLVSVAMYNKCTHILFMDDDIYDIKKSDLDKLFEADKDVIGGVMHASKFPHAMCVFRRFNTDRKVVDMPVDNSMFRLYEVPCTCPKCGLGQTHWDAKFCPSCGQTLDNLIQQADLIPFAFTLMKLSVFDKIKKPWFHCTNKYPTDSWFADRVLEAGLKEYGHMGVRLNHAGITDATKPYYAQMGLIKAQQLNAVVTLEPQQMEAHQRLLLAKMEETEAKLKPKPVVVGADGAAANKETLGAKDVTLVTHGK